MGELLHDLRYAVRTLLRSPGFALVAVLTLALGIGANAAIFSVVDAILLRPLPYPEPERLVTTGYLLRGEYRVLRERSRSFEQLALYQPSVGFNLSAEDEPERLTGALISTNLFATLGVSPMLGRGFVDAEEQPAQSGVVILSHGLWRQRFGADPGIVGREILVDSEPRTVVGVMPAGFHFPTAETRLWLPLTLDLASAVALWGGGGGQTVGRLAMGVTPAQAQSEIRSLAPQIREANTLWTMVESHGAEREVVPLLQNLVGEMRTPLFVLLGAVGLVLLIACANVANLLLARSAARGREVAIRTALGAGRARLVRQLLTESLVLSAIGGLVGLALAFLSVSLLVSGLPAETPRLAEVRLDLRVLGFTAGVILLTGVLFGMFPALRASRTDVHSSLHEGGRGASGGAAQRRLSSALVCAEIALAVVLVISAGLLIRSFRELLRVDAGFRMENLVSARITPAENRYPDADRQRAFYRELLARVGAIPGVQHADAVDELPLIGGVGGIAFEVEEDPYVPGTAAPVTAERRVTPDYTRTMGIPLLQGRPLADGDHEGAPPVALINQTMARRFWPGEDALGKRFKPVWWRDQWITVVGVVGDVKHQGLTSEQEPEIYRPLAQAPASAVTLVLRTTAEPAMLAGHLRSAVAAVDPQVPVSEIRTLDQVLAASVAEPRFTMLLLAAFAGVALILGAVGIYGLIAYTVTQRTRELGIRVALGATSGNVLRMVVGQGLALTLVGVGFGLAGALAATRVLRSLLYGISPTDPFTFVAVPLILAVVALLASYLPARRAARVDPVTALRYE